MLQNCVFKIDVDTKDWFRSTIVRAIKTFAQTAGGMITVGAAMTDINWKLAFSVALVAAIYSVLTSIGGLPEVHGKRQNNLLGNSENDPLNTPKMPDSFALNSNSSATIYLICVDASVDELG